MKKTVFFCDTCEKQINDKPFRLRFFKERRMDPAGSTENWEWVADLCMNCTIAFADRLMKWIDKQGTMESLAFIKQEVVAFKAREE